jgi:hypothetical protein
MKSLFYSWMIFQMLVGIWLFISPFLFHSGETHGGINNMIFGAIVVILGECRGSIYLINPFCFRWLSSGRRGCTL